MKLDEKTELTTSESQKDQKKKNIELNFRQNQKMQIVILSYSNLLPLYYWFN